MKKIGLILILFSIFIAFPVWGAVYINDADLLALYRMEETSGTRYDETTNNEDLTDNNTVLYQADNKSVGSGDVNCADFEKDTDEFLSRAEASLSSDWPGKSSAMDGGTGGFSIVMWVKPESFTTYAYLSGNDIDSWWIREATGEDNIQFCVYDTDYRIKLVDTVTDVGVWHHIAMTWAGGATDELNAYKDGSVLGSPLTVTAVNNSSSDNFNIGFAPDGAEHYDGRIDEVAIFKRELSSVEVSEIHANGIQDVPTGGGAQIIIISWLSNEWQKLKRAYKYGILSIYLAQRVF